MYAPQNLEKTPPKSFNITIFSDNLNTVNVINQAYEGKLKIKYILHRPLLRLKHAVITRKAQQPQYWIRAICPQPCKKEIFSRFPKPNPKYGNVIERIMGEFWGNRMDSRR